MPPSWGSVLKFVGSFQALITENLTEANRWWEVGGRAEEVVARVGACLHPSPVTGLGS